MNAAPVASVISAPSTSTNPFDNKIDLRTKEGILVCKIATDPNLSLDHIALTVKNGDRFLAQTKRKYSEF